MQRLRDDGIEPLFGRRKHFAQLEYGVPVARRDGATELELANGHRKLAAALAIRVPA